jgi:hypothetical protein
MTPCQNMKKDEKRLQESAAGKKMQNMKKTCLE